MAYPTTNTAIASYAGTALMGDIDHAGWHGITNTDLDGVKTTLGTTAGTSVLKNMVAGDFVPTEASGAEVNTGTATLKYASPKAIADAGVNTRLKSKIITSTKNLADATGDTAYTGVGFTPTSVIAYGVIDNSHPFTVGFSDSSRSSRTVLQFAINNMFNSANLLNLATSAGNQNAASVKTYDADGFTLTWTKTGSPTGTASIAFLCLR